MEPIVAECLAAAAGACMVTGMGLAMPRSRKASATGPPVDARSTLGAVAVVVAAIAPGPKIVTVPLAILLVLAVRRFAEVRARALRRRAMDAEIPQLLDLLAGRTGSRPVGRCRIPTVGTGAPRSARDRAQGLARLRRGRRQMADRAVGGHRAARASGSSTSDGRADAHRDTGHVADGRDGTSPRTSGALVARQSRSGARRAREDALPARVPGPPRVLLLTVVPVLLTTVRSIR